jgi:Oxygen-sensitive ribonucleoside-triphosphate reductase
MNTPITTEELLDLPRHKFIERCLDWLVKFNDGKQLQLLNPTECPVHQWVVHNHKKCGQEFVPNIASCQVCGSPCCPQCMNHEIEQLSRVTGYISAVSGWNAGKKQELKDRHRVDFWI